MKARQACLPACLPALSACLLRVVVFFFFSFGPRGGNASQACPAWRVFENLSVPLPPALVFFVTVLHLYTSKYEYWLVCFFVVHSFLRQWSNAFCFVLYNYCSINIGTTHTHTPTQRSNNKKSQYCSTVSSTVEWRPSWYRLEGHAISIDIHDLTAKNTERERVDFLGIDRALRGFISFFI